MNSQIFAHKFKRASANISCKWASLPDVARSRAFEFVHDVTSHLQGPLVNTLFETLLSRLSQLGESEANLRSYREMLTVVQTPFRSIESEHLLLQYLEKDLGLYIPPEEIIIDKQNVTAVKGEKVKKDVSFQFIPLRKVFKKFFEIPNVLKSTQAHIEELEANDTILANVVQTEMWKEKKASFGNRLVLPLELYQDEYQTNNPLGSHKSKGKVGAIYCFPACLPPNLQSKVENIFLLTLYRVQDAERVPPYMLFSKAVEELKFLETSGITVDTEDGPVDIFFTLSVVIGDNIGVNFMLGFSTGFTANHPCRFCEIHKEDLNKIFDASECKLRTEESYQRDLLKDDVSKTGINRPSVVSDLKSSSALSLMAADITHDINEGVFEYDFGLILSDFIKSKDIPLDLPTLNDRIETYFYGDNEKRNIPPLITEKQISKKHIKMSASESMTFIRNIGVMIGDLIPRENELWQLIIIFKEIVDIVTSPVVSDGVIKKLDGLITKYLTKLQKVFGNCLKPKHHLLLHYALILLRFGSLSHLSTMRCESKHQGGKTTTKVSRSRVNVCKTIAIKNQLQFCYRLMNNDEFIDNIYEYESSESESVHAEDIQNFHVYSPFLPTIKPHSKVNLLSAIRFHGRTVKKEAVLMIPTETENTFFIVQALLEDEQKNLFIVTNEVTDLVRYDEHFQAYEVEIDGMNIECLTSEKLRFAYVSFVTKAMNGKLYIPKRWI